MQWETYVQLDVVLCICSGSVHENVSIVHDQMFFFPLEGLVRLLICNTSLIRKLVPWTISL